MIGFFEQVKMRYADLNETEKEMISYVTAHLEDLHDLSIVEMAAMLKSSRSSVLRLAQKLGYRGYSQMKYEMKEAVDAKEVIPANLEEQFQKNVLKTFELVDQVNFMPLLHAIDQAEKLIIYATGFVQNNYAKQFSSELYLYGKPNFLVSGETNFEVISRTLTSKDLVIVVGFSGNTPGIQNAINLLSVRKVPICSITALSKNKLTDASRFSLFYQTSSLPIDGDGVSLNALSILMTVLARKYLEFILYDEV